MNKKYAMNLIIVLAILIFAGLILKQDDSTGTTVNEELTKCIGENSKLYVQLGCSYCETQEKMFGDTYKLLDSIDCFYKKEECNIANIRATPTWVIKGEKYEGVQSINKLQKLTGC